MRTDSGALTDLEHPLVSVVIPVYNQGSFLPTAIESVLAQDYRPIELIVVDDGSTDATPAVLERYADRLLAARQENQGAAAALNNGIAMARGQYVCWLSADDEFLPGKLSAQVAALRSHPEHGLTHTGYDVVDEHGRLLRRVSLPRMRDRDAFVAVFWANPINGSTVMLRRELFDRVGPFDVDLRADVDADMWLRLLRQTRVGVVPGVFLRYRVHRRSLSADRALMAASITRVRRRYLDDGSLAARLAERPPDAAADVLARMAIEFATRGLHELGIELAAISRTTGTSRASQAAATVVLLATRWHPLHAVVATGIRPIRRLAWRVASGLRQRRLR